MTRNYHLRRKRAKLLTWEINQNAVKGNHFELLLGWCKNIQPNISIRLEKMMEKLNRIIILIFRVLSFCLMSDIFILLLKNRKTLTL